MFNLDKGEIKILAIILVACILSGSGGYYIAHATNGNLTIDDTLGIYNVPWLNATKGTKTPYIETLSINLSGITKSSWPSIAYPEDPFTFFVYKDGSNWLVLYGNRSLAYSSSDPDVAVNWALSNLDASRTWKEKVIAKGNLQIDSTIQVPKYCIFEWDKISPTTELDPVLNVIGTPYSDWNYFVELKGHIVYSSGTGTSSTGVLIDGAWDVTFDLYIDRCRYSIKIDNSEFIRGYCWIQNAREKGLWITSSSYTTHSVNIYATSNFYTATANCKLIYLESQGSTYPAVSDLLIEAPKLYGASKLGSVGIEFGGSGSVGAKGVKIIGGHSEACDYFMNVSHPAKRVYVIGTNIGRGSYSTNITAGVFVNDASARVTAEDLQFYGVMTCFQASSGRIYVGRNIEYTGQITKRYSGNVQGLEYEKIIDSLLGQEGATLTCIENRVYLVPIEVTTLTPFSKIGIVIEGTNGQFYAGVYKDNGNSPDGGELVIQSIATDGAGTNTKSEISVTKSWLEPGIYWIAIEANNTAILRRGQGSICIGGTLYSRYYNLGSFTILTDPCPVTIASSQGPYAYILTDILGGY